MLTKLWNGIKTVGSAVGSFIKSAGSSFLSTFLSSLKKAVTAIVEELFSADSLTEIITEAIQTVRGQGLTGDEAFKAVMKLLAQWAVERSNTALATLLESTTESETAVQVIYAGLKRLGALVEVGSSSTSTSTTTTED